MKIKSLLLFLMYWIISGEVYSQNWRTLSSVPGNTSFRHDDAFFVTTSLGYTVLYDSNVLLGTIFKTTNGGSTWFVSKTSSGTHFRSITFMNEQIGIAGNLGKGSYDNTTDTIPLYRTTDGGQTWNGINPGGNVKGMCALYKVDSNTIYGAGRVRGPAHLLKSTDKGLNWQVIPLTTFGLGAAMDLYFASADTGFVVGMNEGPFQTGTSANYYGRVIYTTNGGQTWSTVLNESLNPTYFWKISFPTKKVGYVSLQQNTSTYSSVVYYKTTNSGANWTRYSIPTSLFGSSVNFYTQGIGFVDEKTGWIGGGGGSINFLETKDGGATWSNITSNESYRINKFRMLGDTFIYAAGLRISSLKRQSTITGLKLELENEISAVTVFPNPVVDNIEINLNKKVWTNAFAALFSIAGDIVREAEILETGNMSFEGLKPGIYFLRLSSGQKIWFTRIVKE